MVSNFVKGQDETIYEESGDRALEIRKLRESLVARKKYNRASAFMYLELTLVQDLEMRASVDALLAFAVSWNKHKISLCCFVRQHWDDSFLAL